MATHLHPVPRLRMRGAALLLPLHRFMGCTWTATVHENSSTREIREKCMQSFGRKTRRTEKEDLNGKYVVGMKQGWPQRSSLTSLERLAQVSSKNVILR